jgi:phosphoglycolate phosphatase
MFPNLHCILFDLDGTLLDSAPDLSAAANDLRAARGLPALPLPAYHAGASSGARGMLRAAFGIDPSHAGFASLRDEFLARYAARLTERTRPFDGVPALIQALVQRGLRWGVVTNKARRLTEPLTAALPLFASAGCIVSGDTTAYAKPHPEPLLHALRQIGAQPEHSLYVGDDERDIQAGRAAGVATVAARYGYLGPDADVASWRADAVIDQPLQLLALLG